MIWDYHVIAVVMDPTRVAPPMVYDLDTTLPFPCPFEVYVAGTFPWEEQELPPQYRWRCRVVTAQALFASFASDRSHMRLPGDKWQAPPPTEDPIKTVSATNNLFDEWLQMKGPVDAGKPGDKYGCLRDLDRLEQMFASS